MPMSETSQPASAFARLRGQLASPVTVSVLIAMVVGMACTETNESGSSGNGIDRHCKISAVPEDCLGFGGVGNTYVGELYVQTGMWGQLRDTLAANSSDDLFVTDGAQVFMVSAGVVTVYLTAAEITAFFGGSPVLRSLDVGPDDNLYIRSGSTIAVSTAPGDIALGVEAGLIGDFRDMSVESPTRVILSDLTQGMVRAEAGATTLLAAEGDIGGLLAEDMHGIAVDLVNGHIYNLPGSLANEELWVMDLADGANPRIVLPDNLLTNSYYHGIGKHPTGGVFVNLGNDILEVQANGNFSYLDINPSIDALVGAALHPTTWVNLNLAVSPNGVIYAIGRNAGGVDEIFRLTPN